jgi:predicted nucleotidyltransferase component of viral defense system
VPEFLHELKDAKDLFETVGAGRAILPVIVEKDYWVMHCLWGLQQGGFDFEMKGGTSLSKGWKCIDRFSEDIDLRIEPPGGLNLHGEKLRSLRQARSLGLAEARAYPEDRDHDRESHQRRNAGSVDDENKPQKDCEHEREKEHARQQIAHEANE